MSDHIFRPDALMDEMSCLERHPSWRYVHRRGDTEPLVLLPGGELDFRMWVPLLSVAAREQSYLLLDVPKLAASKDEIVRRVDDILAVETVETFSLLGYAFGAFVALYMLPTHHSRMTRLILSHTTFEPHKLALAKKRLGLFRYFPNWAFRLLLKHKRIIRPISSPWRDWAIAYEEHLLNHHIDKPLAMARANVLIQFMEVFAERANGSPSFDTPTLVLDSADDPTYDGTLPVQHTLVRRMSKSVTHYVFDENLGGHHTPILAPRPYHAQLLDHLRRSQDTTT